MTRTQERTLGFVNRVRQAVGLKPLKKLKKGDQVSAYGCPVACSLNGIAKVYGSDMEILDLDLASRLREVGFDINGYSLTAPKYVGQFVGAFDNGRYPELIARGY